MKEISGWQQRGVELPAALQTLPEWSTAQNSADGKWIAFTGSYDGSSNVYVIPSERGEPVRATYHSGGDTGGLLDARWRTVSFIVRMRKTISGEIPIFILSKERRRRSDFLSTGDVSAVSRRTERKWFINEQGVRKIIGNGIKGVSIRISGCIVYHRSFYTGYGLCWQE